MTAELKAKALVQQYFDLTDHLQWNEAIQCADILVGEILSVIPPTIYSELRGHKPNPKYDYWQEVKAEIEKLKI